MRCTHLLGVLCAATLLAAPSAIAGSTFVPMDQQMNAGLKGTTQSPTGNGIYALNNSAAITFGSDGVGGGYTRGTFPGNGYYYLYLDTRLAGLGNIDLSSPDSKISFDVRYFQDAATNTRLYQDAPVFFRAYSYADDGETLLGYRDYDIVYATQGPWSNKPFPDWTTITIDFNNTGKVTNQTGVWDPARVNRIRWWGTDWYGKGNDFVDVRNVCLSGASVGGAAIPEPGSLALLAMGALPLLGLRRRKA